jgi:hypothetical protein
MKLLHPEKFTNARRDNASSVESVDESTGLPKKAGARTYENLPAEAKAQCKKFTEIDGMTKEYYVANYPWDQP